MGLDLLCFVFYLTSLPCYSYLFLLCFPPVIPTPHYLVGIYCLNFPLFFVMSCLSMCALLVRSSHSSNVALGYVLPNSVFSQRFIMFVFLASAPPLFCIFVFWEPSALRLCFEFTFHLFSPAYWVHTCHTCPAATYGIDGIYVRILWKTFNLYSQLSKISYHSSVPR